MTANEIDIPPLFAHLVDDASLLRPVAVAPPVEVALDRYLEARASRFGGLLGRLGCPVSRLPQLVVALTRRPPASPVEVSLVVDTGLGAVPKALSTVLSRASLLVPRSIETAAPPDVDDVWLERVAEFVPDDVTAIVEPRRPTAGDEPGTSAWLAAVGRIAEHGCSPKLRCGGPRASDVPSIVDVERFVQVAVEYGRGFTVLGLREMVRTTEPAQHGLLNMIVAVARALAAGDVRGALDCTDGRALAAEVAALPDRAVAGVRTLLSHSGTDPDPVPGDLLVGYGLLPA